MKNCCNGRCVCKKCSNQNVSNMGFCCNCRPKNCGPKGPTGQGPVGPTGPTGATGYGDVGPTGPRGEAGSIGTLAGSFDSVTDLIANEHNHQPGNFYLVGTDLWFFDLEHGVWANAGSIAGPVGTSGAPGPAGPQGLRGTVGALGPIGPTGASGPQGEIGAQGPAGSIGTIAGGFNTIDELLANEPNHRPGNFYLVAGDLYFWDEEQDTWSNAGTVQGPQGPTGPQGPVPEITVSDTGTLIINGEDTGQSLIVPVPVGDDSHVVGLQAELSSYGAQWIAPGSPVPFENETKSVDPSGLSYDASTQTFTITRTGLYIIDWWLSTMEIYGLESGGYIVVALEINGEYDKSHTVCSAGTYASNITGHDLVNVTKVPTTLRLLNISDVDFMLGRGPVQGGFLIHG